MIVVHKNTAFKNIMQAKDEQDYLGLRPISVVIYGEDGNLFEEYEIEADCYLFMASRKADAVAAILLFISIAEVQFTKRSVERMGNASDMNTRHFSGE